MSQAEHGERHSRRMLRARAQQIMRQMVWDETVTFVLCRSQPERRITYQVINQAAYRELGAGSYRMGMKNDYMWVKKTTKK